MRQTNKPFIPTGELLTRLNLSMPQSHWLVYVTNEVAQTREQPPQFQPPRFNSAAAFTAWAVGGAK